MKIILIVLGHMLLLKCTKWPTWEIVQYIHEIQGLFALLTSDHDHHFYEIPY